MAITPSLHGLAQATGQSGKVANTQQNMKFNYNTPMLVLIAKVLLGYIC